MEISRRHAMAALTGGLAVALHPVTDQFSQFLRLAFLRSPNYAAGVTGWTINQDGSAEFNNLTIRGTFNGTNFLINTSGAFFYSGVPAAGNLIASITNSTGTDAKGNSFLLGITSYFNAGAEYIAVSLQNAAVNYYTAATEAGPWTAAATISIINTADLNVQGVGGNLILSTTNPGGQITVSTIMNAVISAASASLLTLQNTHSAPTSPIAQILANAAGDNAFGIRVTADTINRLRIDSNGKVQWGPGGAAALDTDLFRAAIGVLQTDSTLAITNQAAPATLAGAAQLYAASGQIAAENPQGLLLNLSGAQLATVNVNTVTQTAFTNLASATIPAADAVVGATYKIRAKGNGTWGSTQQQLNLGARFGAAATNVVAQASIAATAFAISAAFTWRAVVEAECVTTGAGGTWIVSIHGTVTQTANAILPGTAADNSVPFAIVTSAPITLDTTIAEILGISASWASTTGAPTISKRTSSYGREA